MRGCQSLVLVVLFVNIGVFPRSTGAYSSHAHFVIGNCAWHLLEDDTKANIQEILDHSKWFYESLVTDPCTDECTPLGKFAKWADDVRDEDDASEVYGFSEPFHYVEVPDKEIACPVLHESDENTCWVDYDRDCPGDHCIVGTMVALTLNLRDNLIRTSDQRHRRMISWVPILHWFNVDEIKESVLFLTHLFGDIHCPLHVDRRSDYGGTWITVTWIDQDHFTSGTPGWLYSTPICSIPFVKDILYWFCASKQKPMQLHRVWDREIVSKAIADEYGGSRNALEQDLLQYIENAPLQLKQSWLECADASQHECVMEWANDSLEAALRYAYTNVDGSEIVNGTVLTEAYYERSWSITKEFMARAVVRMAYTFNLVL